jgi:hypothetical protein
MKEQFKSYKVSIDMSSKYGNGRRAIKLVDLEDGELVAVATVNLPDEELGNDEVFIKDYSENEGILEFLVQNKVVFPPHGSVKSGYVTVHKCKLNEVRGNDLFLHISYDHETQAAHFKAKGDVKELISLLSSAMKVNPMLKKIVLQSLNK